MACGTLTCSVTIAKWLPGHLKALARRMRRNGPRVPADAVQRALDRGITVVPQ